MLPAGYLSRAFMKDWELTRAEQVVDRIHTNHFVSVPDHQLNETQREKFRLKNTTLDGFPDTKDDFPAVIHPSRSRRASSTSVSRRYNMT
ncbi:hypothetical protein pdam_00025920 [Pocillopora damicornis]|uniref:Uncharacterized protein n=1 Tax=Pocillopora damicornis TaxID=46731 RepID=A0A3M6TU48_POCDA|nr:hypothetical protein pdam_00025920 [Pocillopora damicornis]